MPSGRYEIKKSLSELEARAESKPVGRGARAGAREVGTARSGRGSMIPRDGKGLVTSE